MLEFQCKTKQRFYLNQYFIIRAVLINRHFTLIVSFTEAPCSALYRSAQQSLFRQQWQILRAESPTLSLRLHSCPSTFPLPIKKTACCDLSFPMQASISLSLLQSLSCISFASKVIQWHDSVKSDFIYFISCDWLLAYKQWHTLYIL